MAYNKLRLEYDEARANKIIHLLKVRTSACTSLPLDILQLAWVSLRGSVLTIEYGLHCVVYRPVLLSELT